MKKELFFKVLDGKQSCNGGEAKWIMNRWMPEVKVDACRSGYHLCRPQDLIHWLGKDIYLAEGRGSRVDCNDKVVFAQARIVKLVRAWDEKSARLFACWCARQTWDALTDDRSKNAVRVSERFAKGLATADELEAARSAARSAVESAAESAARSAAWSAQTRRLIKILGINIKTGEVK